MDPAGTSAKENGSMPVKRTATDASSKTQYSKEAGHNCGLPPSEAVIPEQTEQCHQNGISKKKKEQSGWRIVIRNFTPS